MAEEKVNVAIIGGGIVGCSIAYHLARRGINDVIVIEKSDLTSGSTWHAAGLVGQLRSSRNITHMLGISVELYKRLEEETGQPTGWKQSGGLRIASSRERMQELKRGATTAKSFGLEMEILTPSEAKELFPIMCLDGVVGAAFLPTDGEVDPAMVTMALAKGARNGGVRFVRNCTVNSMTVANGHVREMHTTKGVFRPDVVVNAAGMWADEIGNMVGVNVPLVPMQHQYMVSEPIEDMPTNLVTARDPDSLVYYKEEQGGLVMGGYEHNPLPWATDGIPPNFNQQLLQSDYDHFEQLAELAMHRTPILAKAGVRKLVNGPEAFTPDGNFMMGRAPELKNFFVAAGFNAHGIAAGGGVGQMLAEWILDGAPSLDLWSVDIRRLGPHHRKRSYVIDRTVEFYGKHYSISWPYEEHKSARDIRLSSLYDVLRGKGAVFGSKYGWERPNWFSDREVSAEEYETFDRPQFFCDVEKEHLAIRSGVAIIDQSSFSKLEVEGVDALRALDYLADNDVDKPVGSLTYTQLCNEKGGIEADLTIARIDEEKFFVVTGTAFGNHDAAWINGNLEGFEDVRVTDVADEFGVINVCGPKSRELLQSATDADIGNEMFPFGSCKEIDIAGVKCLALRVTYVGELGYELHRIPMDGMQGVYSALWEKGQPHGVINAGYYAIESCRLEKGYRYWSADITPDYTPYEAGLGFCVSKTKNRFLGKEALERQNRDGVKHRLCTFTIDQPVQIYGSEAIASKDGTVLGNVTSGGYGFFVKKTILFAYLLVERCNEQGLQVEVMGEEYNIDRVKGPLYDPKRERVLA